MFDIGGSGSYSSSQYENNPWNPQANKLEQAFKGAQDLYNQGAYQGDYTSSLGDYENQFMQNTMGYYNGGAGAAAQQQQQMYANQAMGSLTDAQNMYNDVYDNQITTQSINDNINQDIMAQQQAAAMDATSELLMATQNSNDVSAASSGNLGSSMQMQTQNAAANDAAADLQQSYNNIYQNNYQNTQNAMQNQQQANLQTAGAMTNIANMGSDANMQAQQMYQQGLDSQYQVGQLERAQADRDVENELSQYYSEWDLLNNYMGIIGSNNWGSEGSSSEWTASMNGSFGM